MEPDSTSPSTYGIRPLIGATRSAYKRGQDMDQALRILRSNLLLLDMIQGRG